MNCWKCEAEIPEGHGRCLSCWTPAKREGFLARFFRKWLKLSFSIQPTVIRTEKMDIQTITDGVSRNYQSLDELPPEIREKIKHLTSAGTQISTSFQITIKDSSGEEKTYRSLEEMPPEARTFYEKIRSIHNNPKDGI